MVNNNYWFKAYKYGYGWYPCKWQGWLILLVYVILNWFGSYYVKLSSGSGIETLVKYLPQLVCSTILLFVIVIKTGEKAKWTWRKKI